MAYYLTIPCVWGWQFFHNTQGILCVLDITRFRPLPAGLISPQHPWATGLNPATGEPIWHDNVLYRSPRPTEDAELPPDAVVVQRVGEYLAQMAALSAVGAAVSSAGCASKLGSEFGGQQLRIFVYAGGHEKTMREVFVPRFEAATGAAAVLDAGWWDAIPKLKASPPDRPPYDLLITDATQGFPAARDGRFRSLDLSRIPNHKNLAPSFLDHWIYRDRDGIPFPDSVMTLAYHKSAPQAAANDASQVDRRIFAAYKRANSSARA